MSIKKIKSFGLILCCIVLCMCVVGMITVAPKTRADDDVTAITIEQLTTFTTEDAASIRTETPTGIRFTAAISADEYDGLVKEYGLENLEFGMAIARVGSLEELKALDASKTLKPMSYWAAGAYPGSGAATYKYSFAIVELDANNYNTQYTTIGYVKVGSEIAYATNADGEEVSCTRTPLAVATATLANASGDEAEDLSFANAIIDSALSTATFEVKDITAPWGEEVMLNATVDGKSVTPVYEIEDATIATAEGGKIIGLKKGSTTVTAILNGENGNSYTATATVTFTEKTIAPALNSDGMLDLLTAGEETSISVYAANDVELANVLTTATTTAQTFDIREHIISYMEENDITANAAYTVKVNSASYAGAYNTETFMPIATGSEFYAIEPSNWVGFDGYAKTGNYYYLTSDIDISAYASNNTAHGISMWACLEFNLDGRGYTISNTYTHTSGNYGGIAVYWGEGTTDSWAWKNVHYKANVIVAEGADATAIFAGNLGSFSFFNCYIEANVVNNGTNDAGLFGANAGGKFVNSIIELNNSSSDAKDLVLLRHWDFDGGRPLYDCVIINNDDATEVITTLNHNDAIAHTVYRYNSLIDFMAGNNGVLRNDDVPAQNGAVADGTKVYENWSDVWEVTDTDVKLFGQTVRTTLKSEVTPVLTNGMLSLNTQGEQTAIKVYDSTDAELTNALVEDLTDAQTYDIRELILSYMEDNVTATGKYSYIVTVESESYVGTYTSETFVPITKASEFVTMFTNSEADSKLNAVNYYYLTTDMDISEFAARNTSSFAQTCLGVFTHASLDGRGHTVTNTYEHTLETSNYVGLAGYMGHQLSGMVWRNVHYKMNIVLSSNLAPYGLFAMETEGYTFYNCYIEANVMNDSSAVASVMNIKAAKMYDCIIELNKASASKNDVAILGGGSVNGQLSGLYNCAIINSLSPNAVTTTGAGQYVSINDCSTYGSFAEYVSDTARYEDWTYNWTDSKVVGDKETVTPTYADGTLTLNTNGEVTTVKLYATEDASYETALATTTAMKNIDVYEFIVSYMEENVKTYGEYSYNVVVESDSYKGVYATEKFVPISNENMGGLWQTRFAYVVNAFDSADKVAGYNFFLTEDIDVSASARINSHAGQLCVASFNYINLDGRGHTITNTISATNEQHVGLFGQFLGSWKNVHFKLNATLNTGARAPGLFAYYIAGTIDNCYFEINVLDNSTYTGVGFANIRPGANVNNCVVEINRDAQSTNTADVVVCLGESHGAGTVKNLVVIKPDCDDVVSTLAVPNINSCYQYDSVAEFISGTNGLTRTGTTITNVEDGTKCYTAWDSVWSITDGGISLCGQQIKTVTNA